MCTVTWYSPGWGWTARLSTTCGPGSCNGSCTSSGSARRFPIPACCWNIRRCIPRAAAPIRWTGQAGDPGAPVIDVDRGGKITWHGPGQLVGYPIVTLAEPMDVVGYVRTIETALIAVCAEFGVQAGRVEGRSGVWLRGDGAGQPDRKVAAIGIRVARGVTMHGFALNCDCDLSWYDRIVPCGLRDASVTTLSAEAGRNITVPDTLEPVQRHLAAALGATSVRLADGLPAVMSPAPVS